MIPALGPPEAPTIQSTYRHLLAEDRLVWTRWLEHNAHRISAVWYDVHVGASQIVPAGLHPSVTVDALAITRKRIDVVAEAPGEIWVIELKPWGNYTALGQVQVYSRLFTQEYPTSLPIIPMIICCQLDPDLIDDCQQLGIRFDEVGYPAYGRP